MTGCILSQGVLVQTQMFGNGLGGIRQLIDFVDLSESVGLRRIGRRTRIADARRDLQRAELHRLVDRNVE